MKILVVTGSSGGHIYPALSFLDALNEKHKNIDTLLILPKKNITNQIENFDTSAAQKLSPLGHSYNAPLSINPEHNSIFNSEYVERVDYRVNYISVSSIKLNFDFKNFIDIVNFFKGFLESILILFAFRPDIIVGFGSLASVPIVIFGRLFGAKILIHEQNVIPGRANRFLAKFTDRIAISFSETKGYFKSYKRKVVLTGCPLRKGLGLIDKNNALDFFGFNEEKFTLLVIGGSQGSRRINLAFLRAISKIPDTTRLQAIHLAGYKDYDLLKASYKDLNANTRLFSFLNPMQYAYSASDFVISRAGAVTIAELIFFGLPAILIPYPFAYKHQIANAKVLEKIGSAIIIKDDELDSGILQEKIEAIINNPDRIKAMRVHYGRAPRTKINDLLVNETLSICSVKDRVY